MRYTMNHDRLQSPQDRDIFPGDHICVLLGDEKEEARSTQLTRLFQAAFEKGWKVLFLARTSSPDYIHGLFSTGMGTGGSSHDVLEVLSSNDPAFHLAFSDSNHARNFMETSIKKAGDANFSSLCIIREVPPIPYRPRSSQRVTGEMAGIEKLLEEKQITLICLYEMGLFPSEVLQDVLRTHPKAIIEGEITQNIFYIPSADAKRYSLSSLELGHWIRTLLNLTHYRNELEESEARFRDFLENANDLIQSVDAEGKFLYTNRAWRERLGYDESEIAGLNLFDILDPSCVDECRIIFTEVMKGRLMEHVDAVFRTRTGEKVFVEGNVNCRTYQGKPVYTRGIFREKEKQDSARDNGILEVLKRVPDAMNEEIIAVDGKGEVLYANKAAWKAAGSPEGETGRIIRLSDIFSPGEDLSAVTRLSEPAGKGERPSGFRVTMRDGSGRVVETRDLLIPDQPAGSRLIVLKSSK
jgi:PAS domain S-box-containing protein